MAVRVLPSPSGSEGSTELDRGVRYMPSPYGFLSQDERPPLERSRSGTPRHNNEVIVSLMHTRAGTPSGPAGIGGPSGQIQAALRVIDILVDARENAGLGRSSRNSAKTPETPSFDSRVALFSPSFTFSGPLGSPTSSLIRQGSGVPPVIAEVDSPELSGSSRAQSPEKMKLSDPADRGWLVLRELKDTIHIPKPEKKEEMVRVVYDDGRVMVEEVGGSGEALKRDLPVANLDGYTFEELQAHRRYRELEEADTADNVAVRMKEIQEKWASEDARKQKVEQKACEEQVARGFLTCRRTKTCNSNS